MNRSRNPEINPITRITFNKAQRLHFPNGVPFYYINSGTGELIKIEWMFSAGNFYQPAPLIAFAVNNSLSEGSSNYNSVNLLNAIEYYGASLGYSVDKDNAFVSIVVLRKYIDKVMPLMEELIKNALFPEKELEIFRQKHKQQFLIEQNKVGSLARAHHANIIFGNNHPYGYLLTEADFDRISRPQMIDFYQNYYHAGNCKIIASGKVDEQDINTIAEHFGGSNWLTRENTTPKVAEPIQTPTKIFIEKKDAVQNAIRIGKVMFNKTHADYGVFSVVNSILGGYFGSRLMKKIREEKGYTYGINSLYVSLVRNGFLAIVTEVGSDVTANALECIYGEIEALGNQLISDDELQRVKNYMMGDLVRMFDGPFAQADNLISLLEYNLDYNHFEELVDAIMNVTPEKIAQIAHKYLDIKTMSEVVVGKSF